MVQDCRLGSGSDSLLCLEGAEETCGFTLLFRSIMGNIYSYTECWWQPDQSYVKSVAGQIG